MRSSEMRATAGCTIGMTGAWTRPVEKDDNASIAICQARNQSARSDLVGTQGSQGSRASHMPKRSS